MGVEKIIFPLCFRHPRGFKKTGEKKQDKDSMEWGSVSPPVSKKVGVQDGKEDLPEWKTGGGSENSGGSGEAKR